MNAAQCTSAAEVRQLARKYARIPVVPVVKLGSPIPPRKEEKPQTPPEDQVREVESARPVIDLYGHVLEYSKEAAFKYGLKLAEMYAGNQKLRPARARQEVMYRLRAERNWTCKQIANALGFMDHTTVLSGIIAHAERNQLPIPGTRLRRFVWTEEMLAELRTLCATPVQVKYLAKKFGCEKHNIFRGKRLAGIPLRGRW